jgi:hypothetical protein
LNGLHPCRFLYRVGETVIATTADPIPDNARPLGAVELDNLKSNGNVILDLAMGKLQE